MNDFAKDKISLHLGTDIFGWTTLDHLNDTVSGQGGIKMSKGKFYEEVMEKHQKVN